MAVAENRLFCLGCTGKRDENKETFQCLDAETGKTLWKDTYTGKLFV